MTNIQPAAADAATADVAVSGPKFAGPVTQNVTFVNQGGNWVLSRGSAMEPGAGGDGERTRRAARVRSSLAIAAGVGQDVDRGDRPSRTTNPMIAVACPATKMTAPAAPLTVAARTSRSGPA